MKFRWLALTGCLLISNIQPISVEAQSEQARYAQQRSRWRAQDHHNDVQKRMEETRRHMEESRNRMGLGNSRGSSSSSYGSSRGSSYGSNHGSSYGSSSSYRPSSGSSYANTTSTYGTSANRTSSVHSSSAKSSEEALLSDPSFKPPAIAEISTYPGRPAYSYTTHSPKVDFGTMTGFRFRTTDSPSRVYGFYTKDLQAHGWKFDREKCKSDYIAAEHPKVNRRVTISYKAAESGGTDVDLNYSQNLNLKMGNDPISNFAKSTNFSNMGNNERVKANSNPLFPGVLTPASQLNNNERVQRGLK